MEGGKRFPILEWKGKKIQNYFKEMYCSMLYIRLPYATVLKIIGEFNLFPK